MIWLCTLWLRSVYCESQSAGRSKGVAMQLEFTAVFRKVPEGYVAFVEELAGANTQGATLAEARENLAEAAQLVIEANRTLSEESLNGADVIREPMTISAA